MAQEFPDHAAYAEYLASIFTPKEPGPGEDPRELVDKYARGMAEFLGLPLDQVLKAKPVQEYARRIGVTVVA